MPVLLTSRHKALNILVFGLSLDSLPFVNEIITIHKTTTLIVLLQPLASRLMRRLQQMFSRKTGVTSSELRQ